MIQKKDFYVKRVTFTACFMALCVVLPMAFHMIPGGGNIFLPMHIPVLVCGMVCGWQFGMICGMIGPILSCVMTGMPATGILPPMVIELGVYGLVAGLLTGILSRKKGKTGLKGIYFTLIISMLSGRVVAGVVKALFFMRNTYSVKIWITASFVTCWPGILLQLAVVPLLVTAIRRMKLM